MIEFLICLVCFNFRLRDELLNETLFRSIGEARRLIEAWLQDYIYHRPHFEARLADDG